MPKDFNFYGGPGFDPRSLSEVLGEGIRGASEAASLRFRGAESLRDSILGTLRDVSERRFAREQLKTQEDFAREQAHEGMRFQDQQARLRFGQQALLQSLQERAATKREQLGVDAQAMAQAQRAAIEQQKKEAETAATNALIRWQLDPKVKKSLYIEDTIENPLAEAFPDLNEGEIRAQLVGGGRPQFLNDATWSAWLKTNSAPKTRMLTDPDVIKSKAGELVPILGAEAVTSAFKSPAVGMHEIAELPEQKQRFREDTIEQLRQFAFGTVAPVQQPATVINIGDTTSAAADERLKQKILTGQAQSAVVTDGLLKQIGVTPPREMALNEKTGIAVTPDYGRILADGQPYLAPGGVLQGSALNAWNKEFNTPNSESRGRLLLRLIKGADTTRDETDKFWVKVWENRVQQQAATPAQQAETSTPAPAASPAPSVQQQTILPADINLPGLPGTENMEFRRPNLSPTELLRIRSGAFSHDAMKKKRKEK